METSKTLGFVLQGDVDKKKLLSDINFTMEAYKDKFGTAPTKIFMSHGVSAKVTMIMGIDDDTIVAVNGLTPMIDSSYRDNYIFIGEII